MKPVTFKEQNIVYAKDQPEYQPLPALKLDTAQGEVITCWELSFWERVKVLFTGKVWLALLSFNKPLSPSLLTTNKEDLFQVVKE